MVTKHTLFSNMRLPQLAAGHVSVLLKNRQLFSWGVWWSHVTYSPEIVPLTVLTTLNVGGYFPFSYLENGSIKNARSLGVRAASGKPKWSL